MERRQILITTEDHKRLHVLLESALARIADDTARLDELRGELSRAVVVPEFDIPEDVVTMDSTITFRDLDTNEIETYTLVYPDRADIANGKLSVLAPIGTAVLGYRVGHELKWLVPAGWRRLKVEQVVFQPERDGLLQR